MTWECVGGSEAGLFEELNAWNGSIIRIRFERRLPSEALLTDSDVTIHATDPASCAKPS